ncbi:MAG: PEP-CTERM sorting domain-containing protein [Phycisphaeraceae bacterium]|nr:PEP-CTERM sorting domain-containing protein [Phycisphaeraceae bacterium]
MSVENPTGLRGTSMALAFGTALCVGVAGSHAAIVPVMYFGGDMASSNLGLPVAPTMTGQELGGGNGDDTVRGIDLGLTSTLFSPPAYSGPGIYGGLVAHRFNAGTTAPGFDTRQLANDDDQDYLEFRHQGANRVVHSLLFGKDDFIGGGDALPVELTNDSTFRLRMTRTENLHEVRFVVGQGGNLYISQLSSTSGVFSNTVGEGLELTFADLNDVGNGGGWALYTPSYPILQFDASAATFNAMTFDDVEWVGFYLFSESLESQPRRWWHTREFEVNAFVIPEPASLALLGLGGLVLLGRRRA